MTFLLRLFGLLFLLSPILCESADPNQDQAAGIVAGLVVGGILIAVSLSQRKDASDTMKPASLDAFGPTQNSEGTVVPWIRGRARIPGTILWYGNLLTEEVTERVGGKGFGGQRATTGYNYYLDVWQELCQGPNVSLVSCYIDDVAKTLGDLGTYELNTGDDGTFPTEPGIYAHPMTGVAHIFLDGFLVGLNRTQLPTIHWVVDVTSDAPLTNANLSNGCNPAAVIYDLLLEGDIPSGDIDTASFQEAATYWATKGYGINVVLTEQREVREWIDELRTFVDFAIRVDENDRYFLKAYMPNDTPVDDIPEEDFKQVKFKRRLYADAYSHFTGKYVDEDQAYTDRVVRGRQGAVRRLLGYNRPKTLDLRVFRDRITASKRLHEIMERDSYPEGQISCTLPLRYDGIYEGAVVTLSHSRYALSSERYRCEEKTINDEDSNEINFKFVQSVEDVAMDSNFLDGGQSQWSTPDYTPVALTQQAVFELPYNAQTGEAPAYLLLAARAGQETSFISMISYTGADYEVIGDHTTFSQHGTLDETYGTGTYSIDDDTGILFTPTRDDPTFSSISRTDLFAESRFAIIDDEIIAFQTVTPEGANSYRLTGCIRGVLNTPVQQHTSGSTIWLTRFQGNIITGIEATTFYLKLRTAFGTQILPAASATPITVAGTGKAKTPWAPGRVEVVKTGSSNVVTVWPTTRVFDGAGVREGDQQTDKADPDFLGTFEWYTSITATVTAESAHSFTVTQSGAFTLYVRANISGYASGYATITVGASDGTYVGPEIS